MGRKKKALPLLEQIEIESVAAEGNAVAHVEMPAGSGSRMVVFVPYGAPGDIADIQLTRKKHSFAEGRIERLLQPSPVRVEPRCRHFGECGGCRWQHLPYEEQLRWKTRQVADTLQRIAKVELPEVNLALGSENVWNYRNKMEYTASCRRWLSWDAIRAGSELPHPADALGFHVAGAFDKVLHIEECLLQAQPGNEIRNAIFDYCQHRGYTFFNIKENHGLLRTVMIRNAESTGQLMVCVVFGEDDKEAINDVMTMLATEFPQITSLLYVVNLKLNDSIADQEIIPFRGEDYIEEMMEGLRFRVNTKSFYQTNSRQAYRLYQTARDFALRGRDDMPLIYDLYTGAGTIANFVARKARKVIGIEYVEEAVKDARLNSQINGIDNTLFYAGDMKDILTDSFIAEHGRPEVMIVDPPRAGMHEDVVKVILNAAPEVIVYVSCNPATQARDLALLDAGYRVTDVQPVDMFPHTHHVENVVRLVKR